MKKLTIMSVLCFVFLLTNAQTISIVKIEGTDTISIVKEIDNRFTEITLSNGKVKHQRIVAFDTSVADITPSSVTTMFYDNTILSFLIHHQGKNYSYCLVAFDGQKWDTKIFKRWKDTSIFYGVYNPAMYENMVESIEMTNPYEVVVTYTKQILGKKFVFSVDGKTQVSDYYRK